MTVPVTTRLPESYLEALDDAVAGGLASSRGDAVRVALSEWLARHAEEAIVESYRARYADADPAGQELVASVAEASLTACLAAGPE
ncbi:MAG: ribbon-helix-helix domain-containing protein [Acidimicrobiales bacterium]